MIGISAPSVCQRPSRPACARTAGTYAAAAARARRMGIATGQRIAAIRVFTIEVVLARRREGKNAAAVQALDQRGDVGDGAKTGDAAAVSPPRQTEVGGSAVGRRLVFLVRPQLTADFASRPSRGVQVRVCETGADGANQFLERRGLSLVDPLRGGADNLGSRD